MELQSYLDRINYRGPLEPTFDTLCAIHTAHLQSIAYENLDIHLGNEVSIEFAQIVDKIIHRQRGGWCFEMNSLLAWALTDLGYSVALLGAAVGRQEGDDSTHLNHLILRVDINEPEQPYLADVGFGNGFLLPLPLAQGTYSQEFIQHELTVKNSENSRGWCSYRNVNDNFGFDFTLQPRTINEFADQCHRLQTSPESGFVKATVCQIFQEKGHISLRGVVLKEMRSTNTTKREIDSLAEYSNLLTDTFGLKLTQPEIEQLWSIVLEQHQAWVAAGRP